MGLWDSFITLTNTISQEGWGGRTRQPAYFALQNRLLNFLTPDFWVTFILHCLTHAVAANEHLSLDAVIQHAASCRDRIEAAGMWGESVRSDSDDCMGFVKHAVFWYKLIKTTPQRSCSPSAWTVMKISFIMQVAGLKREKDQSEQGNERSGGGKGSETPPFYMHVARVHLFLSLHRPQ